MKYDIVIAGAGAAGLIAAKELSEKGYSCCLLEAAARAGGRIETIKEKFRQPAETGAEFIHGSLPLTIRLLKEANISFVPVKGQFISIKNGRPVKQLQPYHEQFLDKAMSLESDMTLLDFFDHYFSGDTFAPFRDNIRRFAEGFDLADPGDASVFSLRDEWSHEEGEQYRIPEGYSRLIDYLLDKNTTAGTAIHFNSVVSAIDYKKNEVTIYTEDGRKFESNKLIITVSVAVLKKRLIQFNPVPQKHLEAIDQIGFGTVIKFLLEFKKRFWEPAYPYAGFFITDETIPTWWTQLPAQNNLLTGWLGGPSASLKVNEPGNDLLQLAINSLASAFGVDAQFLNSELVHQKIINWQNNPHVNGGYSYSTVNSKRARQVLSAPVADTLFFAGEALWKGKSPGTVEAALQSGMEVSQQIISLSR